MSVYIIAEAGVNHNGSKKLAFQLVDAAIESGADAVKFQTFKAEALALKSAQMAEYQKSNTGKNESQLEMLKRLELSREDHFELIEYCRQKGIEFLSTPFDMESVKFLCRDMGLKTIKVPSGELTNAPYLLEIARYNVDIILSTGMADLDEIRHALDIFAYGFLNTGEPGSFSEIDGQFASDAGFKCLRQKVTLLHCTTEYPAPLETINLNAMTTLSKEFGLKVGMSDHSEGNVVAVGATALGAVLIEKHMTLDKMMEGPDHKASLEPGEMKEMVQAVRKMEMALGNGEKKPFQQELSNKKIARKGLYAAEPIKKGEVFTAQNMVIMRPEEGMSPLKYWDLLGKKASQSYKPTEPIENE